MIKFNTSIFIIELIWVEVNWLNCLTITTSWNAFYVSKLNKWNSMTTKLLKLNLKNSTSISSKIWEKNCWKSDMIEKIWEKLKKKEHDVFIKTIVRIWKCVSYISFDAYYCQKSQNAKIRLFHSTIIYSRC